MTLGRSWTFYVNENLFKTYDHLFKTYDHMISHVLGTSHCIVLALSYDWLVTVKILWRHELQTGRRTLRHFFSKNGFLNNEIRHFIDYVFRDVTSPSAARFIMINIDLRFSATVLFLQMLGHFQLLCEVVSDFMWLWIKLRVKLSIECRTECISLLLGRKQVQWIYQSLLWKVKKHCVN